jgi:hypothetical protein
MLRRSDARLHSGVPLKSGHDERDANAASLCGPLVFLWWGWTTGSACSCSVNGTITCSLVLPSLSCG